MKLFNRRKKVVDSSIPPEVQAYSQAEHRERMGVAWLVGVVSLVLTICILAGLFFGGRWLYRTIAGPSKNDSQSQTTSEADQSTKDEEKAKSEDSAAPKPQSDTSTSTAPNPTPAPATTPTTGPALPHTGPDSDE